MVKRPTLEYNTNIMAIIIEKPQVFSKIMTEYDKTHYSPYSRSLYKAEHLTETTLQPQEETNTRGR